ncbi:MAG: alpha/beta hydrolase [Terracidiphilus sp.]
MPKQRTKPRSRSAARRKPIPIERAWRGTRAPSEPPPTVSGRWLLKAVAISIVGAAFCCWGALCLLFWQGSWQLLYHPASAITRTPASDGIGFDPVAFAVTDTGVTRLTGWWIPAEPASPLRRYTALYLHGKDGNLGDAVDALAALHAVGVNVLAFDYRGYGQSQFARPSETHWREDAEWALQYLTGTRHILPGEIVLDGEGLGGNLALEVAAAHPELAGVILREPLPDAAKVIFGDARAQLVPARLLVRDRYGLDAPADKLRIPSLWFYQTAAPGSGRSDSEPAAYRKAAPRKMLVWLPEGSAAKQAFADALSRWLADLPNQTP